MKTNDRLIELVKKVKNGDNVAFTDLYNESYKYLYTCVMHVVKNEDVALDMLQDAYVEIYKNIGQLNDDAGFLGWAATIANRKCFAYLKKNKDFLVEELTDDEGNETDYFETIADDEAFIPENILDNKEKIKIIRGIIDDLTDVQRACVIGFYYNEQKQDEIANELGLPVNTVKSHLNRAKAKIKEAVGDTERKQGIKLYSIAPFMLLFFIKDTEVYAAELKVPAMSDGLCSTVKAKAATGSAIVNTKVAGMAFKTKLIAGIAAGAVVVAGITVLTLNKGKHEIAETVVEEIQLQDQEEIPEEMQEEELVSQNDDIVDQIATPEDEMVTDDDAGSALVKILEKSETEYDSFGNGYGGVLIVKKGDLYGAVDYDMNEIVPCEYSRFQAPNKHGYFVLSDDEQNHLFSPKGELILSTSDELQTMGGGYATLSYNDSIVRYYDYQGNFWAESNMDGEVLPSITGFHDSCILVKRASVDYESNHTLVELGKIGEDGNTTWQTEYDGLAYEEWHSDNPNVNAAGASYYFPTVLMSGLNDGYYLSYMGPGIEWGYFDVRDANSELVASVDLCWMDGNGNYSKDRYIEENNICGYYYDGCYFYNRGTKMVWECEGKYILVDALDPKPLAIYDHMRMAEDDLWLVQNADRWGYIDPSGNEIAMYDDASAFSNGYALVLSDGIASLVDTNLNVVEELGEADSVVTYGELFGIKKGDDLILYKMDNSKADLFRI